MSSERIKRWREMNRRFEKYEEDSGSDQMEERSAQETPPDPDQVSSLKISGFLGSPFRILSKFSLFLNLIQFLFILYLV